MNDPLDAELALALELADLADAETLHRYERRAFTVERKPDRTEVTEADRAAEAAIGAHLATVRADHSLYGEEHGVVGAVGSPWRWIVDPVDGTANFVRGIPVWATLVALAHQSMGVVVGVVSAPALGRRWWAAAGQGAFVDSSPIHVSRISRLDEAQVCITFSRGWDELGLTPRLVELAQQAHRVRGFGDFWQHMLVAEGAAELAVDAVGLAPYDVAAVEVIVREAGGRLTDRCGRPGYEGDTAISSNGLLHDEAISRLAPPSPQA